MLISYLLLQLVNFELLTAEMHELFDADIRGFISRIITEGYFM